VAEAAERLVLVVEVLDIFLLKNDHQITAVEAIVITKRKTAIVPAVLFHVPAAEVLDTINSAMI